MARKRTRRQFRVFVLGAGFSRHAGLPLGNELFGEVIRRAKQTVLYENKILPDLREFNEYKASIDGRSADEMQIEDVDFEEFVGFLDIEHFLAMRGSDQWSDHGNQTQVIVKNLIAETLLDAQDRCTKDMLGPYLEFARRLLPDDFVFTFNYDTLLEQCLDAAGVPYRLVPTRVVGGPGIYEVDDSKNEVVVLKMHGSIDWFDRSPYESSEEYFRAVGSPALPNHPVFRDLERYQAEPISPNTPDYDPLLSRIYRARKLASYLQLRDYVCQCPFIISPSYSKLVYLNPLKEFWKGFNYNGSLNGSCTIIGYSLPEHDDYARQGLYRLIRNFQNYDPGIFSKNPLKLIDFRKTPESIFDLTRRYPMVDWSRAVCYFGGFGEVANRIIFDEPGGPSLPSGSKTLGAV